MQAYITAPLTDDALNRLKEMMNVIYKPWRETGEFYFSSEEFSQVLNENNIDVLVAEGDNIPAEVLQKTNLRIIALTRNDPNNVDIEVANEKNIPVIFTPHRNADSVADLTVGLILALARKLVETDRFLHSGKFEVVEFEDLVQVANRFLGMELHGKQAGIIGFGGIGRRVAERLQPFGVKFLVFDPYVKAEVLTPFKARAVSLEELMRESDIVTIHAAPTDETDGLISEDLLALMKPTALFVNTSKGSLVDEDALEELLTEKKIAGAALDVFQLEPLDEDNPFLELPNVIALPHVGGNTDGTIENQSRLVVEGISKLLAKETPTNLFNPEVLPEFFKTL